MSTTAPVLLVDDDEDFRKMLSVGLQALGHQTHQTENAYQAKKWLSSNCPCLIILDLIMPDMNGLDFCRWIRAQPGLKDIPVLFLSGIKDAEVTREAMKLGALDFLYKPHALQTIEEKLARLMVPAKQSREEP